MTQTEIIVGPPGCGKTTSLLEIVDEELTRGTESRHIGYVSFTRRAAEEAQDRAIRKFGLTRRDLPHFRTLHSLCYRALGLRRSDVLEGPRMHEFSRWIGVPISTRLRLDEGTDADFSPGDRAMFMENLARVTRVPLRELYDRGDDDLPWSMVERLSRGLAQFKQEVGLVDFTDMLSQFAALGERPRLEVLLVDEAQDLSRLQWEVVEILRQGARRVVVAGDDDQAIYQWAGAAVEEFIGMPGETRTLSQSFRVPRRVQEIGQQVIERVQHRRPKEWRPREVDGVVRHVSRIEDVDVTQGDTLILARNVRVARRAIPLLQSEGVFYEFRGQSSVPAATMSAIVTWETLRAGGSAPVGDVQRVYHLTSHVARGQRQLRGWDSREEVTMEDLRRSGGLQTDAIWHEALDRMVPAERSYILRARQRGEKLRERPRVRVSTIHGAKGAEASHVVLMQDMAYRTRQEMDQRPDEEARVWYVGITRALERLTIVAPRTKYFFAL